MIDGSVCFVCLSTQLDMQLNTQIQCSTYPGILSADNIQYIKHTTQKNIQQVCLIHILHLFISSSAENMLLLGIKISTSHCPHYLCHCTFNNEEV